MLFYNIFKIRIKSRAIIFFLEFIGLSICKPNKHCIICWSASFIIPFFIFIILLIYKIKYKCHEYSSHHDTNTQNQYSLVKSIRIFWISAFYLNVNLSIFFFTFLSWFSWRFWIDVVLIFSKI